MITIYDLLQEMQSFLPIPEELLVRAKKSNINSDTHVEFRALVNDWEAGIYDEDPEMVVSEIEYFLHAYPNP